MPASARKTAAAHGDGKVDPPCPMSEENTAFEPEQTPRRSGGRRPLRFGIMFGGETLEEWQALCVRSLLASGNASLELLILDDAAARSSGAPPRPPVARWAYLLFRRFFLSRRPRRRVDVREIVSGAPRVTPVIRLQGRFSQHFDEGSLKTIRSHELDFILRFGFNIIRGEILESARYGVWSYHHDDETKYRGSPSGFWEIRNDDPVSGAILQRLTDRLDGGIVLKRGYFATVFHSYCENIRNVFEESAAWPAQVCADVLNGNAPYLSAEPSKTSAPVYTPPGNLEMLLFLVKLLRNKIAFGLRKRLKVDQWNIGVVDAPIAKFADPGFHPVVEWLPRPPRGKFLADPFGGRPTERDRFLCEFFDFRENRANISLVSIERGRGVKVREIRPAIELPTHLSYPYTFVHDGSLYCVPETWSLNAVHLYRATDPSGDWEKIATLIDGIAAVDSTIFRWHDRWWLFCTQRFSGSKHNLFVFHAQDLLGPWAPHACNPVKTDIRSSRPGGTPFEHGGRLYRPTQDCSRTYGGRVVLTRVEHLSCDVFQETEVRSVDPVPPYSSGLHTLAAWGDRTLVDGKRSVFLWQR
jgi:hypothetical protein